MKNRALLAMAVLMAVNPVYAQSAGYGARPSFLSGGAKAAETQAQAPENKGPSLDHARNQLAARLADSIRKQGRFQLNEQALVRLTDGVVKNKGIEEAVRSIVNDQSSDSVEINRLRLEIMSNLTDIDPSNRTQIAEAARDPEKQKIMNLANIVMLISTRSVSQAARENVRLFLGEVKLALEGGAPLEQVLQIAKDALSIEKGIDIEIDRIDEAISSHEGVMALFKGADDIRSVTVNGPGSTTLEVRMTLRQATQVEEAAHSTALDLMEMAKDPSTVDQKFATRALADLKKEVAEVNTFLANNSILDHESEISIQGQKEAGKVAESVDELLGQLTELGNHVKETDAVAKARRWVRSNIPLASKVVKDPSETIKTVKGKINEIDQALVKGAVKLEENNAALMDIKARAIARMRELEVEMARVKLTADMVSYYAEQLEATGDHHTASVMKSQLVPRLERELEAALSLFGVLTASLEGINQTVTNNLYIIADAEHLRRVAAPAITVTQTVKIAGQEAAQTLARHKRIARFTERQLEAMKDQIKENNKIFVEMASTPIINPEVLGKVLTELAAERESFKARMIEAGKKLRESNEKLVQVINQTRGHIDADSIGLHLEQRLHGIRTGGGNGNGNNNAGQQQAPQNGQH